MSSYKEERNFKVTMRLSFSHFREVLFYAVKTLLKFEMNKVISAVSSGLETVNQKNKKTSLSQLFLGFGSMSTTPLTQFCLKVETDFKRSII